MAKGIKNKWLKDIICEDYKTWFNEIILIGSGTGTGKTTFVLDVYAPFMAMQDKTILYLCNRKQLQSQIVKRIEERPNVTVCSYQKLEQLLRKGDSLPDYDVYVCDEAHFFLADSEFNLYTDVSYDYVMQHTEATILFMTATYHNIFSRIRKDIAEKDKSVKPKQYLLPTDYWYVDKICWYNSADLYGIVDTILRETDDNILYFCNGVTRMQKFYNHYSPTHGVGDDTVEYIKETNLKYMNFVCSEYSKNLWAKKHSNSEAIVDNADGSFRFKNRVLVSTKCIDNGVDFKDRKLKHIICDIFDIESAIQCLGRKRVLDENDTCTFYIRDYKPYELNIFHKNVQNQLEPAQLFEANRPEWERKFGKNRQYKDYTIYYDFDIIKDYKLNPLRYSKLQDDEKNIKAMIDKETSYREKITNYLGPTVDGKSIETLEIKNDIIKDAICIFLDLHMNERLDKEMQSVLVDTCKLEDRFHRQQSSIGQISKYLEENYGCEVKSERGRVGGKQIRFWVIKPVSKIKA